MEDEIVKAALGLVEIGSVFVLIFVGPVFTIWSVNLLFGTEIPIDFKHWIAVVWLMSVLRGINITLNKSA